MELIRFIALILINVSVNQDIISSMVNVECVQPILSMTKAEVFVEIFVVLINNIVNLFNNVSVFQVSTLSTVNALDVLILNNMIPSLKDVLINAKLLMKFTANSMENVSVLTTITW